MPPACRPCYWGRGSCCSGLPGRPLCRHAVEWVHACPPTRRRCPLPLLPAPPAPTAAACCLLGTDRCSLAPLSPAQAHKAGRKAGLSARDKHQKSKGDLGRQPSVLPPAQLQHSNLPPCLPRRLPAAHPHTLSARPVRIKFFHSLPEHHDANLFETTEVTSHHSQASTRHAAVHAHPQMLPVMPPCICRCRCTAAAALPLRCCSAAAAAPALPYCRCSVAG